MVIPGCLKTCLPGLGGNNLARMWELCVKSRTKLLNVGAEADWPGFPRTPGFPEGLSEELTALMGREYFLEGAKGQQLQALKFIFVFLSPCCLGPGSFQTRLR